MKIPYVGTFDDRIKDVIWYVDQYQHTGVNREIGPLIREMQAEIKKLTEENDAIAKFADARIQTLVEKLEEAQSRANDHMLKAKV